MTYAFAQHAAFQRAALGLVAVGGGAAFVGHLFDRPLPRGLFTALVGAALVALTARRLRARPWLHRLLAFAGAAGALALAWLAWPQLTALGSDAGGLAGLAIPAASGGLFALIASVGLTGAHLERTPQDEVERGFTAARAALGDPERALAERALVAYRRIGSGLAGDTSKDAARLESSARAMVLEVLALAARASGLRAELRTIDRAALGTRTRELSEAAAATADEAARADFTRAASSVAALGDHLAALDAAADRVRARLALEVVALESTALALATRRASAVADQALALTPLVDRLDDASSELRAEAAALAEVGVAGR